MINLQLPKAFYQHKLKMSQVPYKKQINLKQNLIKTHLTLTQHSVLGKLICLAVVMKKKMEFCLEGRVMRK